MTHRIGDLSFVSALPLSYPFQAGLVSAEGLSFRSGRPGEIDDGMAAGELAAGPISSLEYLRHGDRYVLVPDLSLSSWGRFGSTVLFARGSFSRLGGQTVALPHAGATSNVLVKWLLQEMFGVDAEFLEVDGSLDELLGHYPAVLLIGDQAIRDARQHPELTQLDLGEAWWQLMKTPLVQTLWAIQANLPADERAALVERFAAAKLAGQTHHAEVVARATERLGIPAAEVEAYFALLNYDLAPVHRQGLAMLGDFIQAVAPLR